MQLPVKITASKGFTLIELMVGIALSVIVLAGILSVYLPAVRSWGVSADLAEIHDTEAILHETLGDNIRQAGLLGCNTNPNTTNIIDGIDPALDRTAANIDGWAFDPTSFVNPSFSAYAANTDVSADLGDLQGKRLTNDNSNRTVGDVFYTLAPTTGFYRVDATSAPGTAPQWLDLTDDLNPDNPTPINQGDFFIVNDCDNPVIVRASANSAATDTVPLRLNYISPALGSITHPIRTTVNPFRPAAYFIGLLPNDPGDPDAVPTLYRRTINRALDGTAFETTDDAILTGIENLRIEYGVFARDGNGNPYITDFHSVNEFNASPPPVSMANVSAVRITVMIQSAGSNNAAQQTSLFFPDLNGDPVDCYGGGATNQDACPDFVTSDEGRQKSHKVIQFTYALPRVEQVRF